MESNLSQIFLKTSEGASPNALLDSNSNQQNIYFDSAQTRMLSPLSAKCSSLGSSYTALSQQSMLEAISYLQEQLEKRDCDIASLLKDKFALSLEIMELNTSGRCYSKRKNNLTQAKVAAPLSHVNDDSFKPRTQASPSPRQVFISQYSPDSSLHDENPQMDSCRFTDVTNYFNEHEKLVKPCSVCLHENISICRHTNNQLACEECTQVETEQPINTIDMEVKQLKGCVQSLSYLVQEKTYALEEAKAETSSIVQLHKSIFLPQIETASLALSQVDSVINELELAQKENEYLRQKALTAEDFYQKLVINDTITEGYKSKLLESQREAKEWEDRCHLLSSEVSDLHNMKINNSTVEESSKLRFLEGALETAENRIIKLQHECNKGRLALERETQRLSLLKDYYEGAVRHTEQLLKAEIIRNTSVA